MIRAHSHLGGQITEYVILLMIFSTHAFSYHGPLWISSIFPHPARTTTRTAGRCLALSDSIGRAAGLCPGRTDEAARPYTISLISTSIGDVRIPCEHMHILGTVSRCCLGCGWNYFTQGSGMKLAEIAGVG